MPTFLLLLLGLTAGCVRTQDSSEGIPAAVASPLKKGTGGLGDPCEDRCGRGTHTTCDNKTRLCKCDKDHPVEIDHQYCAKPVLLGNPCIHHDQCMYHEIHAVCQEYSINFTECQCRNNYEVRVIQGLAIPKICVPETYAAFALAANASTSSSPARGRNHSLRSSTKSASSSRRPSYSSLQGIRPGTRRSSQASLRLVVGEGRGEPIGYYVCIRDPASVHSRAGSRRPSQASVASSSGDLREGRVHHYLYMRAPNYSLNSETNTTTTGTSDSSPRTPKSTEQLLAVYHSVPEHSVLELGGVGSSHTTSTLGSSSDDVFKEEDEDEEEEEEDEEEEQRQQEEAKARLIV
ncbi:uncharacterized protein [Procambarus clarkii]|uniref:uncharacterized protein isoform X5 n=1 Tax=Procambarus clarkii TaxID=6728 RepID=UPI001E67589C|nr:histone H3.v1-like isoform X4 [Procambarus clarkii]